MEEVKNITDSIVKLVQHVGSGGTDQVLIDAHNQHVEDNLKAVIKQTVAETSKEVPVEHREEAQPAVQQSPKLTDEGSTPSLPAKQEVHNDAVEATPGIKEEAPKPEVKAEVQSKAVEDQHPVQQTETPARPVEKPVEAPKAETPKSPVVEAPKVASVSEAPAPTQSAGAGVNWTLIVAVLSALAAGAFALYKFGVLKQFGL